jgi:[ribosomal protein S5]-alanine N-acetyltransferase
MGRNQSALNFFIIKLLLIMIELIENDLKLRGFLNSDKERIALLCNNLNVWNNLRDFIPSPCTEKDAEEFILFCQKENPQGNFVIEYKNELVGVIGLVPQRDVYRLSAEIGYWIGEHYWGLGIASRAVNLIIDYGFNQLKLLRIQTGVFDYNNASKRVLEKNGFKFEGIFEKSVIKNNIICDEYRYAKINNNFNQV